MRKSILLISSLILLSLTSSCGTIGRAALNEKPEIINPQLKEALLKHKPLPYQDQDYINKKEEYPEETRWLVPDLKEHPKLIILLFKEKESLINYHLLEPNSPKIKTAKAQKQVPLQRQKNKTSDSTNKRPGSNIKKTVSSNKTEKQIIKTERNIVCPLDDQLTLSFPGTGWTFLKVENLSGSARFQERKRNQDSTLFRFHTQRAGKCVLFFQDQSGKGNELQRINLDILEQEDFAAYSGKIERTENNREAQGFIPFLEEAEKLLKTGKAAKAAGILMAYPNDIKKEEAPLLVRAGKVFQKAGFNNEAFSLYQKAAEINPHNAQALWLLAETAADLDKEAIVMEKLAKLKQTAAPSYFPKAEKIATYLLKKGKHNQALALISDLPSRFPGKLESAALLFYLANQYENNSKIRNIKEAYALYKIISRDYPYSNYAIPSEERLLYLDRHYMSIF